MLGGEGDVVVVGQARTPPAPSLPKSAAPPQQAPGARQSATSAQATQGHATADGYFSLLRQNLAPREGGLADRPPHEDPAIGRASVRGRVGQYVGSPGVAVSLK